MGVSKEFLGSVASGSVNPNTGIEGEVKNPKVKSNLTSSEISAIYKNPKPNVSVGTGTLDIDYTKYKNYGGMPVDTDIDEYRATNQSVGEQLAFGVGRLVGTTATKFLTGLGYSANLLPAIESGELSTMLDNGFSSMIQEGEEYIKQDLMPIHHKRKYLDGNILNQMGTFSFWMDDVIDGASFMASALVGAKGLNMIGSGIKGYTALAKQASKGLRAAKLGKITPSNIALQKAAKFMDFTTINLYNSVTEAAFEAKDAKDSILAGLERDVRLGDITEDEANRRASAAARNTFGWNVAALMPSNAITNSMMFKKFDYLKNIGGIGAIGKEIKPLTTLNKLGAFGKSAALSMASEGAYEENIQLAVQNYFEDLEGNIENTNFGQDILGVVSNMAENFTTDEGQKNIALGAIIGFIPGGVGGINSVAQKSKRTRSLNTAFNKFLEDSKNGIHDFYQRQPAVDPDSGEQMRDARGNPMYKDAVVIKDGKPVIDKDKIRGVFASIYNNYSDFVSSLKASNSGNNTIFEFIKNRQISRTVAGFYALEGSAETFDDWVDTRAEEEKADLEKAGIEVNEDFINQTREKYKSRGRRYLNYLSQIDNNFAGLVTLPNTNLGFAFRNNLKAEQYSVAVEQDFWREKLEDYQEELDNAEQKGNTRLVGIIEKRIGEVNNLMTDLQAKTIDLLDSSKQEARFKSQQEEIESITEGKGAVDSNLAEETNEVTAEQNAQVTEQESVGDQTAKTETHSIISKDTTVNRTKKFDSATAEANGYQVDDTNVNATYQTTDTSANNLKNNFNTQRSENTKRLDTHVKQNDPTADIQTEITFTSRDTDNTTLDYKLYDNFESLQDELQIEEELPHDFRTFKPTEFRLNSVEYGKEVSFAEIQKGDEVRRVRIKNLDQEFSEQSEQPKPSVFYRADKENKTLHTIITDADNNIVRDTYTEQRTMYTPVGSEKEVALNYVNGNLSSVRVKDQVSQEIVSYNIPSGRYNLSNINTAFKDFIIQEGFSEVRPTEESIIDAETVQTRKEILEETRGQADIIREEIKEDLKQKVEKAERELGLTSKDNTLEEQRDKAREVQANTSYVKWLYGDYSFDSSTVASIFEDGYVKYLPAIYQNAVGVLENVNGQILFKEVKEDGTKGIEYIVSGQTSTDTFGDLDISILNQTPFEFEVSTNNRIYSMPSPKTRIETEGRPEVITEIGQIPDHSFYSNEFESMTDAIEYDVDGNVNSVTLWDTDGNKISFTNPFIARQLAYNIELIEAAENQIMEEYFKGEDDFVIYTFENKEYAVYRKPGGKYAILDVNTERAITGKQHAKVKNSFAEQMYSSIKELSAQRINENNKSKKEIRDEVKRAAKSIRPATAREANKLPDESEVKDPENRKEKESSKKADQVEDDLASVVAEEVALKEKTEELRKEQLAAEEKRELEEESTKDVTSVEILSEEEVPLPTGELEVVKGAVRASASAISYVHFDRNTREFKVDNLDAHIDFVNNTAENIEFIPRIDFNYTDFWKDHQSLKDQLQKEDLTDEQISEILAVYSEDFKNIVDTLPIRLDTYVGNKEPYENGIHMHTTAYDKISAPIEILNIEDAVERQKAVEKYIREQQMLTRHVRKQILTRLLKDETIILAAENKTKGKINNVGENSNLGDIIHKVDPNVDLRTVTIGVGVRRHTIYKNREDIVDTVADISKGNVFYETSYTANGEKGLIKLNPSRLSAEHAGIVFKALKQAYTRDSGGFASKYIGEEVEGGLTRLQVLNTLVYYGDDNTKINPKDKRKAHLINKQLWVEKASILHFGNQTLNLHKASKEDIQKFVQWATTNKNYAINRTMLGAKVKDLNKFRIGNFTYDSTVDNYNSFIIKNGIIKTDVDIVPGTSSLFRHPVIGIDLQSGGIDSTAQKVEQSTIDKYKGLRQEPTTPKVKVTEETAEQKIGDTSSLNIKLHNLGVKNLKLPEDFYNIPISKLGSVKGKLKSRIQDIATDIRKLSPDSFEGLISEEDIKRLENLKPLLDEFNSVNILIASDRSESNIQKYAELNNKLRSEIKNILNPYIEKTFGFKFIEKDIPNIKEQEETVPETEPVTNNPSVAGTAYGQTLKQLTSVSGIEVLPVGSRLYVPIKEDGNITKYSIGTIVKGKTGNVGISLKPNLSHFMLGELNQKLKALSSFAFNDAAKLSEFKSKISSEKENIYFDSPAKPAESKIESKPEPKEVVKAEPEETYTEKPVEDQIENTEGRKYLDLPEDTDTGDLNIDDIGPTPWRESTWSSDNYYVVDMPVELKKLHKRLRADRFGRKIPVEQVDKLIKIATNRHAFAQFRHDGFRLSNLAEEGSLLHEAFHRVSLAYLTEPQRQAVYEDARKNYKAELKETYNKEKFTDKEVEEFLAEGYRDYSLLKEHNERIGLKEEPSLSIPKRIANFFKDLYNFISTWITGRTRLDSYDVANLYKSIDNGRFKYARISNENLTKLKGKAYNYEVKGKEIESIQSPEEYRDIIQNLFFLLAESNRLVETEEATGRVSVKISDYNDVSKIKFGPLLTKVDELRKRYNSSAKASDRNIQRIQNNELSTVQFLELKKKLGSTTLNKDQIIQRLRFNSDVALRAAHIFNDVYNNFGIFKETIEDYMSSMNIQKIKDDSDISITEVDEETGETTSDFDRYNKTSYMSSSKDNTSTSVKFLISMLPREEGRSTTTGLLKFVDFSPTWSRLMNDLIGSRDIEGMMERLKKMSTDNITYQSLIKRLNEDENLKVQFYRTIQKYKHSFVNMLVSAENAETLDYRLVNAAVQQASSKFAKEWGNNFINNSSLFTKEKGKPAQGNVQLYQNLTEKFDNLSADSRRKLNKDGEITDLNSKINQLVDLLNSVNIDIDAQTIRKAMFDLDGITESHRFVTLLTSKIPYIFNEESTLAKVIEGGVLKGPKGNKIPSNQVFLKESGAVFLATAYAETRPFELGDTVYGPQGNRYYTISQNTYMSDNIRELHNDPALFVEKRSDALYNQNSVFLRELADPNKAKKVKLLTMSALIREDMYDTGREYQAITDLEDIMMRITAIESGRLAPPTPADRRFYYFYEGFDPLQVALDVDNNVSDSIVDIFEGYYQDEVNRIKRVRQEVDKVLSGEMSSRDLFETYHYNKYIGRDQTGEGIVDGKVLKSAGKYTGRGANFTHFNGFKLDMTSSEVRAKIQETFKDRLEDSLQMLNDQGIIGYQKGGNIQNILLSDKKLKKYEDLVGDTQLALRSMVANFAINTMYSAIETGKIFTGDPAAFKSSEDYVKRLPGFTSTGDNLNNKFSENYYKDSPLIHAEEYNVTTFSSHEIRSAYYEDLVKLHSNYYLEQGMAKNEEEATKIAEDKLEGLLEIDQTDAQTFISPELFRAIAVKLGEWSDVKESAYQLLQSERELTREEKVELSKVVMQPLKMTYMNIIYRNGHAIPVFDKMSMATLFRPMVENTQLIDLLDRMEAKGKYVGREPIHQVKFHTAEKVGIKDRREFFSDNTEESLTDLIDVSVYSQSFERLRHQLITDPHEVTKTLIGSQFKKIGISNIMSNDIYEVNGLGEVFGEDVRNNVHELLSELSDRGINQFYDELKIDPQDRQFTDNALLIAKLKEEARKAALPDYLIESFKLDVNGNFYLEIDSFPGNRKWIQSRIISLIKKAAIDLKLPGNVFIQMSDIGLRDKQFSDELKFMDKDGFMEAKISVNVFRSLIPNFSQLTHEERVDYIKDKELASIGYRIPTQGQNSIYMMKIVGFLPEAVGDIIVLPKEGPGIGGFDFDIDKLYAIRHNYKNGERVKFLDDDNSTDKERAYTYTEEVLKSELNSTRKEYAQAIKETAATIESSKEAIEFAKNEIASIQEYIEYYYDVEENVSRLREQQDIKAGNYILKKEAVEKVKQLKEDLKETIQSLKDEWVNNNLEEFTSRNINQQNIREAVENRLLDNYLGVLNNRHHVIRRTTPLGYTANMMRGLSENIRKWKGVKENVTGALEAVSPRYQLDVKSRYKFGQQGLGPFALANVHHILGQGVNLGLHTFIGVGNIDSDTQSTDLSQVLGKDNIDITEWFSGLIDAHVDIAADPYVYYLNVNDYTRDLVTLLLRAGVGGINTFMFTAQPILEDIAKMTANRTNKLGLEIRGVEDNIRDRYNSEMRRLADKGFTPETFSPDKVKDILSKGNLENLLTSNNNRTADWYNKQLLVLDAFNYMNQNAEFLKEATLTSRIDTKKFGSSFSEVAAFKNRIIKAYEDMRKGVGVRNYDRLMEDTYLNTLEENSIEVIEDLLGDIVLEATPAFRNFLSDVLKWTGNFYSLKETVIPNIVDEVYTGIYAEFFRDQGMTRTESSNLLYGEESIPKIIHDIRAGTKFRNLKDNRFIRMLEPSYGENRPDFVAVFKPDNKWYRDDISRAWKEIFEGTPAERDFSIRLFKYAFLTSGFKGTLNSYHDLAPAELIKYIGMDAFIKRKSADLVSDENYLSTEMDNFFKNSWNRDDLVPSITRYDNQKTISSKGSTVALITDQDKLYRGKNRNGNPVYAPYTKLGRVNPTLFKYIGFLEDSNEAVYVAIDKKGYRKDGFVVKENVYEGTLFAESNKLGLSEGVVSQLTASKFSNLISKIQSESKRNAYKGFIPLENNEMSVEEMKESIDNVVSSEQIAQARMFKRLDIPTETLNEIENEATEVTLDRPGLTNFWTLPNNQIVWLEEISDIKTDLKSIPKPLTFSYQNNAKLVATGVKTGTSRNSEQSGLKKGESAIQEVGGKQIKVTYHGLLNKGQADSALGMPYEQAEAFESTTTGNPVETSTVQFIKNKGNKHIYSLELLSGNVNYSVSNYGYRSPTQEEIEQRIKECM